MEIRKDSRRFRKPANWAEGDGCGCLNAVLFVLAVRDALGLISRCR
jgi:hypothetical protein